MEYEEIIMSKKQIHLLFFGSSIILIVLTGGGTLSWLVLDLFDYIQYGHYYYDCMQFVIPIFDKHQFINCDSTDILGLIFQLAVTTGITTGLFKIAIQSRRIILTKDGDRDNKNE